jgi:hypothetical protein
VTDKEIHPAAANVPEVKRLRASGPIVIIAILFVVASFLAWYFTWFGRGLSDADITKYLADVNQPRHVQHALLQVQQRIERGDQSAKQWYPQILTLAGHPQTEFRLTTAWLMGADKTSSEFHNSLKQLLADPEPIVRRNAALALVRFNDDSGRSELLAILRPFQINAPAHGLLISSLSSGAQISRGALLARIKQADNQIIELRAPLPGAVDRVIATNGSSVSKDDALLTITSDEQSVWEALRALALIGKAEDLPLIESYSSGSASDRLKQQAVLTAKTVRERDR